MKRLVDIVNFNGDASCLSSATWLSNLEGNTASSLCRWLNGYVTFQKKIVLGLTGATIADMAQFNREAIDIINGNPDVFQLILRPFAHDISLLRSKKGFRVNFDLGLAAIRREFQNVNRYFLPPEFMLTGQQIHLLSQNKILGTFLNAQRFSEDVRKRLPRVPYRVNGVLGSRLYCIPLDGTLTSAYLEALYHLNAFSWNRILTEHSLDTIFSWRDGESPLLIPDGLSREARWLEMESEEIIRDFVPENPQKAATESTSFPPHFFTSYPIHSFTAWMKEFRMLGYVQRVQEMEQEIDRFGPRKLAVWLCTIGSDVLSAVEKQDRTVRLFSNNGGHWRNHRIIRSERGFEGEDYLTVLENLARKTPIPYLPNSPAAHMKKLRARMAYLERLLSS